MTFTWTQSLGLFTLIQLVFLSIVAFRYTKGKKSGNRILGGFLASNALLIANWLGWSFFWQVRGDWTVANVVGNPAYLLLAPFLYLYLRSLCYSDFSLKPVHLLHGLPYAVMAILGLWRIDAIVLRIVQHTQIAVYLVASVVMLSIYRRRLKETYSSIETINLSWCNTILGAFALMWMVDLSHWLLNLSGMNGPSLNEALVTLSVSINLLFTLVLSYEGLVRSQSFSGILGLPKYAASKMTAADYEEIVERLTALMNNEKPYLSASLTVDDLAKRLDVPARQLSQAIHARLHKNFYDFINSYRIEESKKCIFDEAYSNKTLLAVAYDTGFNSKSVFNASFKKNTGMTPKEFRRKN